MHEFHIIEAIVKQVIDSAKDNRASKVTKANLVMGEFSGFEESSIRLYFENISSGTLLEGAQLNIKTLPAKFKCEKCNIIYEREGREFNCPSCGSAGVLERGAKGLYIENIEIESAQKGEQHV